jgi:Putative porin
MRTIDHFMRCGTVALLALGAAAAQAQQPAAPAASAPTTAPPSVPLSAERAELEQLRATTLALIQALVDQGLIARERADALLKQAAAKPAPAPATAAVPPGQWGAPPTTVRVPYIPDTLKAQIKEDIRNDVLATAREEGWADSRRIPPWVRGLTIEGDVRVRAQGELFADDNLAAEVYRDQTDSPAWSPDLTNTLAARKRLTLRARLGALAKVSEDVSAGLRIVAAGTTGPSSASSTLGTSFNRLNASIDRAWLRWEPRFNLRMEAGRTASPYYGTDLLWPDDLSMDGASVRAEHDVAPGVFAFGVVGAFQLEEFALSKSDKWLYGAQVGADWSLTDKVQMRASLALYDFQNVEGVRENEVPPTGPRAGTVPYQTSQYTATLRQRGNTLINLNDPTSTASPVWGLASRFRPINLTTAFTFSHFQPYLTGLTFDYVKNTGFDLADIRRRAGTDAVDSLREKTTGLQLRGHVGTARLAERGDWQAFVALRKFERDAWVDAFTDTTWHLGGTNYKGFSVGGQYAMDRNTTFGLRWTSTRNLDDGARFLAVPGDPTSLSGNLSSAPLKIDVIQVEVQTRF